MNYCDFYITPDEYETAEKNGINAHTLEQRIRDYGWDKKRALTTPKRIRKNREAWIKTALSNGISKNLFYNRIATLNWDEEKAATTPIMERTGRKSNFSKKILDKVKANGISMHTFRRRVREGWDIEVACTLKTMDKKEVMDLMHLARKKSKVPF